MKYRNKGKKMRVEYYKCDKCSEVKEDNYIMIVFEKNELGFYSRVIGRYSKIKEFIKDLTFCSKECAKNYFCNLIDDLKVDK
jgi:hypothetical protein